MTEHPQTQTGPFHLGHRPQALLGVRTPEHNTCQCLCSYSQLWGWPVRTSFSSVGKVTYSVSHMTKFSHSLVDLEAYTHVLNIAFSEGENSNYFALSVSQADIEFCGQGSFYSNLHLTSMGHGCWFNGLYPLPWP